MNSKEWHGKCNTLPSSFEPIKEAWKAMCNSFILLLPLTSAIELGSSPYKGMSISTNESSTVSTSLFPKIKVARYSFFWAIPKISVSEISALNFMVRWWLLFCFLSIFHSELLKTGSLDNAIREFSLAKPSWYMSYYTMVYRNGERMRDFLAFLFLL